MTYEEVKRAFIESNFWKESRPGCYSYTAGQYVHDHISINISFSGEYIYILIDLPRVTVRKTLTARAFKKDGGFLRAGEFEFYIGLNQCC